MTTESSSPDRGVGRLNSMQVVYVRGLHRGKDPAYRLKGDAAAGTRKGIEGHPAHSWGEPAFRLLEKTH